MDKRNFFSEYLNYGKWTYDKTISQEVVKLRTGVMVGGKYPYILKKLEFGNSYQFLYLFYYQNLVDFERYVARSLFDVPFGLYRVTVRIKDAESNYFECLYEKYVDLTSHPDFIPVGEDRTHTIYTLSLKFLGVVHKRFTD